MIYLKVLVYTTNQKTVNFLVFDNGEKGPRILIRKFHPDIQDEISINFQRFDFQGWHHYCFIFTSVDQYPYPGGYVNLTNKAYMNGNLVNTGKSFQIQFIPLQVFYLITILVL